MLLFLCSYVLQVRVRITAMVTELVSGMRNVCVERAGRDQIVQTMVSVINFVERPRNTKFVHKSYFSREPPAR